MVFTGISTLVQAQWRLLRCALGPEGHERRVQHRKAKKEAKKQRKEARRAAKEARRRQRRHLISPTVCSERTDDEERANTSWPQPGLKSESSVPRALPGGNVAARSLEAKEQSQREFYESFGGYSTVDEEEDEVHENQTSGRISDAKLPPRWTVVGIKKPSDTLSSRLDTKIEIDTGKVEDELTTEDNELRIELTGVIVENENCKESIETIETMSPVQKRIEMNSFIEDESYKLCQEVINNIVEIIEENHTIATEDSPSTLSLYSPSDLENDYLCSIYSNLRAREHRYHVTEDIFNKQSSVRPHMRAVLIDWLVEVHQRFELEAQTLFLTVNYIDRYLAQKSIQSQQFQLVGVAALLIASKFQEIYPCDMDDMLYICERSYSKQDLIECECQVLNVLKFNLAAPSISSFLDYYLYQIQEDEALIHYLVNYFAEICLLDFELGAKYEPSLIACGCLIAVYCYIENQTPQLVWTSRLWELTGYNLETILPCARDLWSILSQSKRLTAIEAKYSAVEFGQVAQLPFELLETLLL